MSEAFARELGSGHLGPDGAAWSAGSGSFFGLLERTPVWVTPGVVSRVDLTAPRGTERVVRGASATLVEFGDTYSGSPLFHTLHARDPHAGETIYELDESRLRTVMEKLGP